MRDRMIGLPDFIRTPAGKKQAYPRLQELLQARREWKK
jgi:hypothetical protein